MAEIAPVSFVVLFVALAIGIVVYLIQLVRLLGLLRNRHLQVFESLGSPSLFFNNSPRNNMLVLGWLWRREFEGLGDAQTISQFKAVRFLLLACLSGFIALLVIFVTMGILINAKAT